MKTWFEIFEEKYESDSTTEDFENAYREIGVSEEMIDKIFHTAYSYEECLYEKFGHTEGFFRDMEFVIEDLRKEYECEQKK